ncbi:MAG: RHS repeat-associated core domain-containing protein [Chloroflexota bacterium]
MPFGASQWSSGVDQSDYDFTGQRLDSFKLLDYNARFYEPAIGRFISADTIVPDPADPQSLNRYSYVYNNPLKYTDPSGHTPCGQTLVCVENNAQGNSNPFGVTIDDAFTAPEQRLIRETLRDFVRFVGGGQAFQDNVPLKGIEQDWPVDNLGRIRYAGNGSYNSETQMIKLPPNLLHATLNPGMNKLGELLNNFSIAKAGPGEGFDLEQLPADAFPSQGSYFKFMLGHELGHGLHEGNPEAIASFNVSFPNLNTINDLVVDRNRGRDTFRNEVFADVIASHIFAPAIANEPFTAWVNSTLPSVLK